MCRTVCVCESVCVHRFGIALVLAYWPVCVYCLGTNCAQSTGSVFGWSCLKAGPQMNRLLSSRSGASEPLGNQQRHNDRDGLVGCRWECRVFSITTSCWVGLPHSRTLCSAFTYVCVFVSEDAEDGVKASAVINENKTAALCNFCVCAWSTLLLFTICKSVFKPYICSWGTVPQVLTFFDLHWNKWDSWGSNSDNPNFYYCSKHAL